MPQGKRNHDRDTERLQSAGLPDSAVYATLVSSAIDSLVGTGDHDRCESLAAHLDELADAPGRSVETRDRLKFEAARLRLPSASLEATTLAYRALQEVSALHGASPATVGRRGYSSAEWTTCLNVVERHKDDGVATVRRLLAELGIPNRAAERAIGLYRSMGMFDDEIRPAA